ncbi:unnamed protein product, partial [Ixodes hexagonus]
KCFTCSQVDGSEELPNNDIFFIDKKGGETKEQPSIYTADYVDDEPEAELAEEAQLGMECFNCGGNHHVSDCTKEIDAARISRKRKEMARNAVSKKMRYFEYEMMNKRYQPGKYSKELRNALNLHPQELPPFVYRMRVLGYPPGWLKDAEIETSGLQIFGVEGEEDEIEDGEIDSKEKRAQYDPSRLVSFPGFNVPLPPGLHEEYNMPPMQSHQQKYEAEKYMAVPAAKPLSRRAKLPTVTAKASTSTGPIVADMDDGAGNGQLGTPSAAPDYVPLNGTSVAPSGPVYIPTPCDQLALRSQEAKAGRGDEGSPNGNVTADVVSETAVPEASLSNSGSREAVRGTPLLTGFSEYTRLPPRENFAKGVSEYIPFENLPGSTGTFDKLRVVLAKVRAALQEREKTGPLERL